MSVSIASQLVSGLTSVRYSWTKEDYEIFDLVSDLEAAEGLLCLLFLI